MSLSKIGALVIDAMTEIEELLHEMGDDGWDQKNEFFVLIADPNDPFNTPLVPLLIDTPEEWMHVPRSYLALRSFLALDFPTPPERAGVMMAVMYACEAWSVEGNVDMSPAEEAELNLARDTRTIHQHPKRVEVRQLHAFARDGRGYGIGRRRGEDAIETFGPGCEYPELVGALPDVLAEVGRHLMGFE